MNNIHDAICHRMALSQPSMYPHKGTHEQHPGQRHLLTHANLYLCAVQGCMLHLLGRCVKRYTVVLAREGQV